MLIRLFQQATTYSVNSFVNLHASFAYSEMLVSFCYHGRAR